MCACVRVRVIACRLLGESTVVDVALAVHTVYLYRFMVLLPHLLLYWRIEENVGRVGFPPVDRPLCAYTTGLDLLCRESGDVTRRPTHPVILCWCIIINKTKLCTNRTVCLWDGWKDVVIDNRGGAEGNGRRNGWEGRGHPD